MAGLVPAIHVFLYGGAKDVDARHKAGMTPSWASLLSRPYRIQELVDLVLEAVAVAGQRLRGCQ